MARAWWSCLVALIWFVSLACTNESPSSPGDGGSPGNTGGGTAGAAASSGGSAGAARGGATAAGGTVGQGGASQGGSTGCVGTPTLGSLTPAALDAELQQPGRSFLLINVHARSPAGNIPGTDTNISATDTARLRPISARTRVER